jgi:hypothetical protein
VKSKLLELECYAPIKTVSEANQREHWGAKHRRKKEQQEMVAVAMQNALRGRSIQLPCKVKLTRIGPGTLDSDNLAGAMKHTQDMVANKLGVDDGDVEKVTWEYAQKPVRQIIYGVRINIDSTQGD